MPRLDADSLKAAVARLIGEEAAATARFGVAVSGGPDSLALLVLAARAFAGRVAAASVDHRIRSEAAQECAMVADIARTLDVPHDILTLNAPPPSQAAARTARYAALKDWADARGCDWIMTAHHADDQLETLMMRLNRGSGVHGLAGVRAQGTPRLLRPLLGHRRDDLAAVVAAAGLVPVDDPANRNPAYDRARVRDALRGQAILDPVAASHSASLLAEAAEAIDWTLADLAPARITRDGDTVIIDLSGLPALYRHHVLAAGVRQASGREPRGQVLAATLQALAADGRASVADCTLRWTGPDRDKVIIRRAPRRTR